MAASREEVGGGESWPGLPAPHCRGFAGGERLHSVYIIEARRRRWGPLEVGGGEWREGFFRVVDSAAALGGARIAGVCRRGAQKAAADAELFACIIHWRLEPRMWHHEL